MMKLIDHAKRRFAMNDQPLEFHKGHLILDNLSPLWTVPAKSHRTKYAYDKLGQVISGKRYWSDGTPVAGQQYEYGFDDIGNRNATATKMGGDQNGANLRSVSYTVNPNKLNQYSSRNFANPIAVDVMGAASGTVTVKVDGQTQPAVIRKGEYYWQQVTSGTLPGWPNVSVDNGGTPNTGHVFMPAATESYFHDDDGNLLYDGQWNYTWDGENRLISMSSRTLVGPQQKIGFTYDYMGRRIAKKIWNNPNPAENEVPISIRIFLYDGWNLIAEIDVAPTSGTKTLAMSYTWGTDLSGAMQGAGGIGGLLFVTKHTGTAASAFAAYDGNGNVVGLVDTTTGKWSAHYEYGPFGETIRANDTLAKDNPFRFSTKYQDNETDLYYYGYRYYNPSTGRWINRDPIEEEGGMNLYECNQNNSISIIDYVGLQWIVVQTSYHGFNIRFTQPPNYTTDLYSTATTRSVSVRAQVKWIEYVRQWSSMFLFWREPAVPVYKDAFAYQFVFLSCDDAGNMVAEKPAGLKSNPRNEASASVILNVSVNGRSADVTFEATGGHQYSETKTDGVSIPLPKDYSVSLGKERQMPVGEIRTIEGNAAFKCVCVK